jgi:hypothetical protein
MPYVIVKQTKKTLSKGKFLDRESGEVFERERLATDRESYLNSTEPVCWVPWIDMALTFSTRARAEEVRRTLPAEGISIEAI